MREYSKMAAELMFFRSQQVFASLCGNRGLYVGFSGSIRKAPRLLKKEATLFRRVYCISASLKEEPQAVENIYSAVCIERLPLIIPDKTELMKRYEELQDQMELERSALSDDEVQVKKVHERKKKLTERDEDENLEVAQFEENRKEFQEEQEEEYRQFQPASRETDADESNDLKSIHRRLQHTLVLLLKSKDSQWVMPQSVLQDKETLRQAAERIVMEACGSELNVKFISNAPAGVTKAAANSSRVSNKVFFSKACFVEGAIHLGAEYQDYVWVTRDEIKDYLKPDICKIVSKFIR